jgi:undecaprenyl-diphosphatase
VAIEMELPTRSIRPPWSGRTGLTRGFGAARRPRRLLAGLVWLALGGLVVLVLVPQAGVLRESVAVLATVHPLWAAGAAALVGLRYVMAAVSLEAAVLQRLHFRSTLLVQLATSFIGRLTPEGLGWVLLNQRYLERSGLRRPAAVSAIALKMGSGGIVRVAVMVVVAVLVGGSSVVRIDLPAAPAFAAVAIAVIALGTVALIATRRAAPHRRAAIASAARDLRAVLGQPRRATVLLASSAVLTVSLPLALSASLLAVGVPASPLEVAAVYLWGTAVAALSPTPGNIGAVEVALSAGLMSLGVASGPAVAAVLLFRLLSFWAPVVPGFIAFRYLQRVERL